MLRIITGSLRNKLFGVVGLLTCVALTVGAVGLIKLDSMYDRLETMVQGNVEKVKLGARLKQDLLEVSRAEKNLIMAETNAEMDAYADHTAKTREQMLQRREQLRGLVDQAGHEDLEDFAAAWDQYIEVNRRVRDLSRLNSNTRAFALSAGEGRQAFDQANGLLSEIVEVNGEEFESRLNEQNQEVIRLGLTTAKSAQLNRALVEMQRAEKNLILAKTQEEMDAFAEAILASEKEVRSLAAELEQELQGENLDRLNQAMAAFESYDKVNDEVRALSRENGNKRAVELARTEGRELLESAESKLTEVVDQNLTQLQKDVEAAEASYHAAFILVVSVIGVGVLAGVILAWFIVRGILRGIRPAVQRAREVASKDLTAEPLPVRSSDEIGQLTEAINEMSTSLSAIVTDVRRSASDVAAASTEIAATAEEVSAGVDEQTDQITQVASAVEEMASSITEVATNSVDAASNAEDSGRSASEGGQVVQQTIQDMQEIDNTVGDAAKAVRQLGKRGEQIGEVITVINDIADQTNLLALNAAIEAARAGEHGRGFAVVADEVRKLADRTTKATEEIAESITAIQDETGKAVETMTKGNERVKAGVEQASRAGDSLAQIVNQAGNVSKMINTIAASAEQQSAASTEISHNVQSIKAVSDQNAQAVTQSATAATELSQKAESLQAMVAEFKIKE
jgi:methyl-accepting chemotaxis protein